MKKLIDIPDEIIKPLKIRAVKSDAKDLQEHIINLLREDAEKEPIEQERINQIEVKES